jgi:hypothetical protein
LARGRIGIRQALSDRIACSNMTVSSVGFHQQPLILHVLPVCRYSQKGRLQTMLMQQPLLFQGVPDCGLASWSSQCVPCFDGRSGSQRVCVHSCRCSP